MLTQQEKMKSTVYAKKLRDRLKVLRARHTKEKARFDADIERWKKDMADWLRNKLPDYVMKHITKTMMKENSYHFNHELARILDAHGPKRPSAPGTMKVIQAIERRLKYIAITGSPTVSVSEDEANLFFADGDK